MSPAAQTSSNSTATPIFSYELSPTQQRYWFLEQWYPNHPVNRIATSVEISGELKVSLLTRCFGEVIQRHQALCSVIATRDERPIALVRSSIAFITPLDDLTSLSDQERRSQVSSIANSELTQTMDLRNGPLFRARLIKLGATEHLLILTVHAIIGDRRSLSILIEEALALYSRNAEPSVFSRSNAELDWTDFLSQTDQFRRTADYERQLQFWREYLEQQPPALELLADHRRPPLQSYNAGAVDFRVPESCEPGLRSLGVAQGLSRSEIFLALFAAMIHRYSRQQQVMIGWVVPGRTPQTERVVGPLENTLAIRFDFSDEPCFSTLLQRTAAALANARANSVVEFATLLKALPCGREFSRPPLVQVTCASEEMPSEPLRAAGLAFQERFPERAGIQVELTLRCFEGPDGVRLRLEYNRDLFERDTINRFAAQLITFLQSCVTNPGEPLAWLQLLPDSERELVLGQWNKTRTDYPRSKLIHELFEDQVSRSPHAVAVVFEDEPLTYLELNRRAESLAGELRRLGVGPDTCVGICMNRSLEMVVAMYAILKAGGAYVPMDPNYPVERLAFMAEDADVPVLLTQRDLAELLPTTRARVLCFDAAGLSNRDGSSLETAEADHRVQQQKPTSENLAYVIYTSGSTGKPKGVMIRHRNAVNFFTGMDGVVPSAPGVWLAVTSISFDIHVLELLWTLTRGFKVVLQGDERASGRLRHSSDNAERAQRFSLPDLIHRHAVSHLQCTPSLATMMLDDPTSSQALTTVAHFFFGGEALPPSLVERLQGRSEIFNMYGPTETTVWSTVHAVTRHAGSICIGRPIANTRVYILDAHLQPAPIGVPGELFIGGEGVARGYLKRPELTNERFIPDPCGLTPEDRLYRTGDLARWRADGTLDFLGRIDQQIKIRGFRIELGEIESALRQHPDVRDAVVSVWKAGEDDNRLAAWIVTTPEISAPTTSELRRFLQARLPEYMIPSCFMVMAALPLTPNGKVDRKALPPVQIKVETSGDAVSVTEWEKAIVTACQAILGVEPLDVLQDLLELCPDFVAPVQLHTSVVEALGKEFPLSALLQFRTARALGKFLQEERVLRTSSAPRTSAFRDAELCSNTGALIDGAPVPRMTANASFAEAHETSAGTESPGRVIARLPLTEGQREIWLASQISDQLSCSFNQSEMLKIKGNLDASRIRETLTWVMGRHEALRLIFAPDGESQLIMAQPRLDWRLVDLSRQTEAVRARETDRLCKEERERPFDLIAGPLCRARLLKLAQDEHLLMLTAHHIICDGVSLSILFRDIADHYSTSAKNNPRSGSPEMSYIDFVQEQVAALQTPERANVELFWAQEFSRPLAPLRLPSDRPASEHVTIAAGSERLSLSRELSERLKRVSTARGRTLSSTLLAGYAVLLHQLSGQSEFVIGVPVSSRSGPGSERVVGHCLNFLPLRLSINPESTLDGHLSQVWNCFVSALENQNFTLGALLQKLERSRAPRVSVMFNLDWTDDSGLQMAGLQCEFQRNPYCYSRFQFSVSVGQRQHGLEIYSEYSSELDASRARRWLSHYQQILQELAAHPNKRIRELPPLLLPDGRVEVAARDSAVTASRQNSPKPPAQPSAPARPEEEEIARIFREVIGIDQIGRDESFFDVGGHSLLATKIIARIAKAFQVELPLRAIFEAPSVAELAPQIEKARQQRASSQPAIKRQDPEAEREKLLARLNELSEAELQDLLRNPKLAELI